MRTNSAGNTIKLYLCAIPHHCARPASSKAVPGTSITNEIIIFADGGITPKKNTAAKIINEPYLKPESFCTKVSSLSVERWRNFVKTSAISPITVSPNATCVMRLP